jgi:hypothetical protein
VGVVATKQVGHGEAIVEEAEVKFAGLEGSTDAAVILGAGEVLPSLGMPPGADEVRAVLGLQEPDKGHLTHCVGFLPSFWSLYTGGRWIGKDASDRPVAGCPPANTHARH